MKYTRQKNNKKGFTLLETMVAIAIVVIAITGPLTIVARSLNTNYFARDQVTAFYLAQEAIEYVRNVRDTTSLQYAKTQANSSNPSWISSLSSCISSQGCEIDVHNGKVISCSQAVPCSQLYFDESTGSYGYPLSQGGFINGGTVSPFTRIITITYLTTGAETSGTTGDEVQIAVVMSWKTGGIAKSFTLKENIMNWQNS